MVFPLDTILLDGVLIGDDTIVEDGGVLLYESGGEEIILLVAFDGEDITLDILIGLDVILFDDIGVFLEDTTLDAIGVLNDIIFEDCGVLLDGIAVVLGVFILDD